MSARIGVIRVLSTDDERLLGAHGRAIEEVLPGVRTISRCIPDQPDGVHDEYTHAASVPKVARLAAELSDQVDGLVLSCAADPGLQEARAAARVPLVGAGSAAAAAARALGSRVGVITLTPTVPEAVALPLADRLIAFRQPSGVHQTRDLLTDAGRTAAEQAADELVAAGVDVLLLACTGMTTIGLPDRLRACFGVPVIDPVLAAAGLLISTCA
ncbi:hydantoin racemase [Microlunatus endophyticus]|uniref:Hydantoin racemase n=1 Tax=Microlunatus endophyticus TaxID=1716077 RepID=A0A917SJJ8_9ACTN|nr:aspartate/glutamate racemase family protein [Microlunatus endophyticus]GGL82486.1 hydantoin racemase [Microlunatus endophyticus]